MLELRPYQLSAREMTLDYLTTQSGNPCVVLPGGAGKSICIADLCKYCIDQWSDTRILMLTSAKELIQQNEEKLLSIWPDAPVGVYSASLGRKEIDTKIIFAGIQSIFKKSESIGHVDLIIVDECDLINHEDTGRYRVLFNALSLINPNIRIVGYTATPYRLGHGLITDEPAIFNKLIIPKGSTIIDLIAKGYLSKLKSKATETKLSTSGVKIRGGDYALNELQKAFNTEDYNDSIVRQVVERSEGRKHWLFFCAGIDHANAMCEKLKQYGVSAASVSSRDTEDKRDFKIAEFKAGRITAMCNNDILTVGFDFPDIDLIAHCRATKSPRLYEQMTFRGTRLKSHIDSCLVLDFAGVISMHGPITDVQTPQKKKKCEGVAPSKECPECYEIISAKTMTCPECGYVFPKKENKDIYLRNDDIMGREPETVDIVDWKIRKHVSRNSGKNVLLISYYPKFGSPIDEYLCIWHQGEFGRQAQMIYKNIYDSSDKMKTPPAQIQIEKKGKFFKILDRKWVDKNIVVEA